MNVFLECHPGARMANRLVAWSNAYKVLKDSPKAVIHLRLMMLNGRIALPKTVYYKEDPPAFLPKMEVTGNSELTDCIWKWDHLWNHFSNGFGLSEIMLNPILDRNVTAFIEQHNITVGVHIRHGDYKEIDWNNKPTVFPPFFRLPDDYYAQNAKQQLAKHGGSAFIATDADPKTLGFLNEFEHAMGFRADPLFDLLVLSRCKVIVGSMSTFSSVASFIGQNKLIYPTREQFTS